MDNRPYMDRLDDFDESTDEGQDACINLMEAGLNAYGKQISRVINGVPPVDRPLAVAALRFIYDGCLNADPMLRESVECIEMLPIAALTVKGPKKGGAANG